MGASLPSSRSSHGSAVKVRRLTYPDLPQVIAIERRVFPTPWSLAMFVLELSKPVGRLPRGDCPRRDGERAGRAT